jgi:membrane-bound metal-dependent hydrolase YbcI (DUF457 family)
MFAGHFGLAAGICALDAGVLTKRSAGAEAQTRAMATKSDRREVPLWALMLSTQLLDVGFVILVIAGVESYGGPAGYGDGWIHAYYTHSLAGALLIALAAGLLGVRWWGRRGGLIVGGTVFSHWLLDLLVHRPDLPILPGNLGNLPLLGFGLWDDPAVSIAIEGLLVVGGGALYTASALAKTRALPRLRGRALAAGSVTGALLVLALVTSALGIG